ncbi:MAG: hypothetical protein NVS1B11_30160 [Terriglobales bacterium]
MKPLRMRFFFRAMLLALVLLTVALISALTAMRFAIHGSEVAVPDLVGKSPSEARRIAEASGLEIDIERQYYSATVPEGRVLSQLPTAGTKVRRGWQIGVAESLGPQRVEIPSVLGQSERAAEMNIQRRGLDVSEIASIEIPGTPVDQVISQNPPPNASDVLAPKISLLVGAAAQPQSFVMPSFVGQTMSAVKARLENAGFHVGMVTAAQPQAESASAHGASPIAAPPSATPASVVISQSPAAGERVFAGATLNFVVR